MYRTPEKIKRDARPIFNKRANVGRLYFIGLLTALIVLIPVITFWQYDTLQLAALDAIGMAPTSTPFASARAERAQELFVRGDVDGALAFYELAASQQPDNVNYLYEYGKLLIEFNRQPEAETLADRIIELAPQDPRGYALKATSLQWSDPAAAIPVAIAGRELGQPYAPLHAALSVAYTNIGRYQEGLQEGDLAIRIDPRDANARRSYSFPLIYTGRYTEAIAQLQQAIAINPNLTAPYFELAALYTRINDEEQSVAIYNRILELEPQNERAYLRLCETYARVGLFREAEPFCDQALVINPLYGSAWRMRGQLRYSRRNYEGAIEAFETCIDLQEPGQQEIECYYIRGLAHYFLNQCDEAWTILNESLELANQQPIIDSINIGLGNIQENCAGYRNRLLPTPVPPTPIPPTPIGGT